MSDVVKRQQIEERIIKSSESVKVVSEPLGQWLNDKELVDFLDAWYELVRFYQEYEDTMLDIEIVREYAEFVQLLNQLLSDVRLDNQHRERARDVLEELEGSMNEIIKEAVTNKYNK